MNLFKQRIKELFISVVVTVGAVGILAGFIKLLTLIHQAIPAVLALLMIAGFVIYGGVKFVNWLFIEPFRKGKSE